MNISEYIKKHQETILTKRIVISTDVKYDVRTHETCVIKGVIYLIKGYRIEFSEYIVIKFGEIIKLKYRYTIVDNKNNVLIRWDNAPHHKHLLTYPHHKHVGNNILPSKEVWIWDVLDEAEKILLHK